MKPNRKFKIKVRKQIDSPYSSTRTHKDQGEYNRRGKHKNKNYDNEENWD